MNLKLNSIIQNYSFSFKLSLEVIDVNFFRLLICVFYEMIYIGLNDYLKNWFDYSINFNDNCLLKNIV